ATANTLPADTLFGVVLHISSAFANTIGRGAMAAAKDYGATKVEIVIPSKMEATEQIALFDAMVSKGAKGILTVAAAAGAWTVPINNAVDKGVIVCTGNVGDTASKQAIYSGISGYADGLILGQAIMDDPNAPKKGKVIIGDPIPGLPVLNGRVKGVTEILSKNPDFEIVGPLDCGQSPDATYAWLEGVYSANPDMVMLVGSSFLEPGAADQFKRKNKDAKFYVCGYDLEPNELQGVKDGTINVTIGQGPYLQGYLPMMAIFENLLKGNPLAQGWANTGEEVVTLANIDEFIKRENDPAVEYDFYKKVIEANYKPIWEKITPFSEFVD
ncbi:MAG: substrate-binding domain-containing protein, partial [Actinomycetota bacterium]